MGVRLKSSLHGLLALGYTRVTRVKTKGNEKLFGVNLKKSPRFRLFFATQKHEGEIVSNRKIACCGE